MAFAVAALLLAACGEKNAEAMREDTASSADSSVGDVVKVNDAQARNAGIEVAQPQRKTIASALPVSGRIDVPPQNMVSVSMPLGGYIRSAGLLPGTPVRKGQVLATLEDPQYINLQQDFLNAKTRLLLTQREYNRQKTLHQSQATSDKLFQQAEAEYNSQQVLTQSLGERLRLIGINPERLVPSGISRSVNLYSPINGYVSKVLINPGKYVTPSDVLFELVNPADIHLALTVFEKDLGKLYIGQPVLAATNSEPDKRHRAKIILIGHDLSTDRSTQVHCHFEDYDPTLVPGTFMNATVELHSAEGLVVPEEAIVRFENKQYAFVEMGRNQYRMTEVEIGSVEDGFVELRGAFSQLSATRFVVKGAYALLMKMKNTDEEE